MFQNITEDDILEFGIIPELLGRLPVRTSVYPLTEDDMLKILTEPKDAVVKQFQALYKMDGVELVFEPEALKAIAGKACKLTTGARSLRTLVEDILKPYSFSLPGKHEIGQVVITKEAVDGGEATLVPRVVPARMNA